MRRNRRVALAIGCAAAGFIAACSSGSTSSSSTASLAALQERYLAAVAPVNAAVSTYDSKMAGPKTTRAELITATKTVIGQLGTFEAMLSAIPFPASMSGHVRAILAAAAALSEKLASGTDADIMKADADLSTAVAALRSDLNLPSATLSG